MSDPILRVATLQSPGFLINCRCSRFCATSAPKGRSPSLSRGYEGILPSSFNMVLPSPKFSQPVHQCRFKYGVFCFQLFPGKLRSRQSIQFADLEAWPPTFLTTLVTEHLRFARSLLLFAFYGFFFFWGVACARSAVKARRITVWRAVFWF